MLYFNNDEERQERIARMIEELWGKSGDPKPAKVQSSSANTASTSSDAADKKVLDHLRRQ